MLPWELHLPSAGKDKALWCNVSYIDGTWTREEILRTSGESDAYHNWTRRISRDNGQTWSHPEPLEDVTDQRSDGGIVTYPCGGHFDTHLNTLYEKRMRRIWGVLTERRILGLLQ